MAAGNDSPMTASPEPADRTPVPTAIPSLEVRDLSVVYRVSTEARLSLKQAMHGRLTGRTTEHVPAVNNVSLTVHEGESVGIVGSNGSGKSTLLRTMAGLLPPTSGTVMVNSEPMLLGVSAALRPQLSGWRNIEIGLLAIGISGERVESLTREVAEFADIGSAIHRPLTTYSSGMRARVHFAIATSVRPRILMVDEALGVGDKSFKSKSYARLDELREHAGTIVFVSHSTAEIERVCNRLIWLEQGDLMADGDPKEVLRDYLAS